MPLTFYAPVVFVKDIENSKNFYKDVLEQEIEHDFGKNVIFKSKVSLWEIDPNSEIASVKGDSFNGNAFELYFETADIEGVLTKLKSHGLDLLHDLKTEPWGQMTFRFFDPDHHLVEIGESMHTFVSRIFKETGSIDSVAQITGISEDVIKKIVGN